MHSENPQFLIIAGPNGAGKSTYSKAMSTDGAYIFDADKEIARIEAQYPGLPSESIAYAVEQSFLDRVEEALIDRRSFTLETNLRDVRLWQTAERLREHGYRLDIIYLGLSSVKESMARVSTRVKAGGHFVDSESVKYNYVEGLKNFVHLAERFDNLAIIDSSGNFYQLKPLLRIENRQILYVDTDIPEWAADSIEQISFKCSSRQKGHDDDDDQEIKRGRRR